MSQIEKQVHTAEPWMMINSDNKLIIVAQDERCLADVIKWEEGKFNAKRIVACVNACAGFDNPAEVIEVLKAALQTAFNFIDGIENFNDEAKEAVTEIRAALRSAGVQL